MTKDRRLLGAILALVLAAGLLAWQAFGRSDPILPDATVPAGATPMTRAPGEAIEAYAEP